MQGSGSYATLCGVTYKLRVYVQGEGRVLPVRYSRLIRIYVQGEGRGLPVRYSMIVRVYVQESIVALRTLP